MKEVISTDITKLEDLSGNTMNNYTPTKQIAQMKQKNSQKHTDYTP